MPGLAAKPILDILAGYTRGANVQDYVSAFIEADYIHRGALKRELAAYFPRDRESYINGKESFVKGVLAANLRDGG